MVSEFTNKSKSVEDISDDGPAGTVQHTNTELEQSANDDIIENNVDPAENESSERNLQEIHEFLRENDEGKVRPLKKRQRMMEFPYSTGCYIHILY